MQNFLISYGDRKELYNVVRAVEGPPKRYEIRSTENPERVGEVFFYQREMMVRDARTGQTNKIFSGRWQLVKQEIYSDPNSITGDKSIRYIAIEDPNINIFLITAENVPYFEQDIEDAVNNNTNYRKVVHTSPQSQIVYMTLLPAQSIPQESHPVDQFIRIEYGTGIAEMIMNGQPTVLNLTNNSAFVVPAGTLHTITNNSADVLQLYSVYTGAVHLPGLTERFPLA